VKILVLVTLKPDAPLEMVRAQLLEELHGSWSLYRSGILREVYATESAARIVFVMEAENAAAASANLAALPLVAAGLFDLQLMELRPFANWSILFAPEKIPYPADSIISDAPRPEL
jgi:hypothetical protein